MSKLTTDFNVDPYYDDFSEDKQFNRILFKPSVAVQARELTQLQTILQTQVSRFGDNIFKEGTIIDGCAITFDPNFSYVKILDLDTSGQPVAPSTYLGLEARGAVSNVYAIVSAYADGLVSQDPNLTTLYIDYTKTGVSEAKVFNDSENILIYNSSNTLVATVTAAGASISSNAVGDAFAVKVSEGVVYAKGHFLQVAEGQVLASKYSKFPSGVSIGFDVSETIVTSDGDSSLLDNASGYNNANAPGADRLKLSPYLVAIPTGNALSNSDFLSLIDFQAGLPVAKRLDTQFNSVTNEMAKRTREESGNYTIEKNTFDTENIAANSTHFNVMVGPGLHYVNGYRAQQFNTTRVPVVKSLVTANATNLTVTTNMGNYVVVDELKGNFETYFASAVDLYDTAQDSITDNDDVSSFSPSGTKIGEANVRAIEWHQGDQGTAAGQWRLYLFNIRMNSGRNFKKVRSLVLSGKASADIVLEANGDAKVKEAGKLLGLYPIGRNAVKSTSNNEYTYKATASRTFTSNSGAYTLSTGLPYSGSLTNAQKKDFILIPSTTDGTIGWVKNKPLNTDLITMTAAANSLTVDLTSAIASGSPNQTVSLIYNAKTDPATALSKTKKEIYVKVDISSHPNSTTGPWSLGVPDAVSITKVYVGASAANSTAEDWMSDVTSSFDLNSNQFDAHYGLSEIVKKPTLSLTGTQHLLVKAVVLQSDTPASGSGYYTVDSYKDEDGVTALSPSEIPIYESAELSLKIDLRNVVDVRPQVANTAAFSTTITGATTNPSDVEAFSGSNLFLAAPDKQFETDLEYYLGRMDKIIVTEQGLITVKRGVPASKPVPPTDLPGGLTLATMYVPPFPSLTSIEARSTLRKNEAISINTKNTRRYTMEDIGKLDQRLQNIEYYTLLSQLEQKTQNMAIVDANGNDRFKNGILVDPATDFNVSDVTNREFRVSVDPSAGEFVPTFNQTWVNLKVANTNNIVSYTHPGQLTGLMGLESVETEIINQSGATTAVPCTGNFYKFNGKLELDPFYDNAYDVTTLPAKNIVNDQSAGFNDLIDTVNNIYPLTRTDVQKIGSTTTTDVAVSTTSDTTLETDYSGYRYYGDYWWSEGLHAQYGYWGVGHGLGYGNWWWGGVETTNETTRTTSTTTTTNTITDTYQKTTQQLVTGSKTTTEELGDFVKDVTFSPFMRSTVVRIVGWGLKPSTRHYFYFDNKDINAYVAPGTSDSGLASYNYTVLNDPKKVVPIGQKGASVTSDAYGHLYAVFYLPAETFLVGERQLVVADVTSLAGLDDATSSATATYNAYNFSTTKQGVTVSTKMPTFEINTTQDVYSTNTVDISTEVDVTVNSISYYSDYWGFIDYYNGNYPPVANTGGQDLSTVTQTPYSNAVILLTANAASTTTGTGSASATAITGSGGYGGLDTVTDYALTWKSK